MRYVRKVLVIGLIIVFLIALVIGAGVIFSVRNVNVTYINYSSTCDDDYEACKDNLKKIKGNSLLFLKDKDIESKIKYNETIVVESIEKVYPCTVNIVLRERVETFVSQSSDEYTLYDGDGKVIKKVENSSALFNGLDGCPNVIVDAGDDVEEVAELCKVFGENFGPVRKMLEKVNVNSFLGKESIEFRLRCGLTVRIYEWKTNGKQKMEKAYEIYSSLSDGEKVGGEIAVAGGGDSSVSAEYRAGRRQTN